MKFTYICFMRKKGWIVFSLLFSCSGLNWPKFRDSPLKEDPLSKALGIPDTSFNSQGYAVHNGTAGGNGQDCGYGVAIDSAGKILVAGSSFNGANDDMVIWRYNSDGTLDTSFNGVGYVVHNNAAGGNLNDYGYGVAIDTSGRILVVGVSQGAGGDYDMVIWRYDSGGSLDTSFNTVGYVTHHNASGGNGSDGGYAIAVDSSGKILVTGYSDNDPTTLSNIDMVVWRYNPDGSLDTSFNGTGYVVHNNAAGGNGSDYGYGIVVDSQGKIVVAGYSLGSAGNSDMAIWRYNSDGSLDTSFNTVGYVTHHNASGGNGNDEGRAVTLDALGNILVAGRSDSDPTTGINYDMVIWRYLPSGLADTSFNGVGYVVHNNAAGGNGTDIGYAIITDPLENILVAGQSDRDPSASANHDMVIWRYQSNGALDTSFNGIGYITHNSAAGGNGNDIGNAILLDRSGRILVAGCSDNDPSIQSNNDVVIWRYK